MTRISIVAALIAPLAIGIAPAVAAPAAAPDRPTSANSPGCASHDLTPPDIRAPRVPETTGQNLSEKLARSGGVICPPEVDPEIRAPTPDAGRTPIIPPPGSPGGDPNVQPK